MYTQTHTPTDIYKDTHTHTHTHVLTHDHTHTDMQTPSCSGKQKQQFDLRWRRIAGGLFDF